MGVEPLDVAVLADEVARVDRELMDPALWGRRGERDGV